MNTALHDTIAQSEIAGEEEVLSDANARNGVSGDAKSAASSVKITALQRDVLNELYWANHGSAHPMTWCTPLDLGASNGSHHSGALAALAKKGLVQFKQRGQENPPAGENGRKRWRGRGSKCYRVTPAGCVALGKPADAAPPQEPDASQGNGNSPNPSGDQS